MASGLVFGAVAIALIVLAIATVRARPWALVVDCLRLGAQLFGALGSAWELWHGADASKAEELRALGVNPTFGIALNLVYSLVAFGLFIWAFSPDGRRTPSRACAAPGGGNGVRSPPPPG
jgi:hypothetical protein